MSSGRLFTGCVLSGLLSSCSIYDGRLLDSALGQADSIASDESGGTSSGGRSDSSGSGGETSGLGGASGGSEAMDGSGGALGGGGPVDEGPELDLIDDMEDNGPEILPRSGRNGRWNMYVVDGGDGVQNPGPDFTEMVSLDGDSSHDESDYAAWMSGGGHDGYAALNLTLRTGPSYAEQPPYDASRYSGLAFYAKVGAASIKSVRIRLVTTDTDPRGGVCDPEPESSSEMCFDHFFTQVTLSEEWQWVEVSFNDMVQGGTGKFFDAPALGGLYALEFQFVGSADYEIWVDDLHFAIAEQTD